MPGDCLTGFFLQPVGVQTDVVVHHFSEGKGRSGLGNLPGRVPGGARGQFCLLEQHHVSPAFMSQVISQAAAHNTAADDDDSGLVGEHKKVSLIQLICVDEMIVQMYIYFQ